MNQDPRLAQAREALTREAADEARALAKARNTKGVRDEELHLAWAEVLEELGLLEDLILELNLAIRDNPERLETYTRLAEVMMDHGEHLRAAKVWTALIKREPDRPDHYQGLGEALKEAGEYEKARTVYQQAFNRTGDSRFTGLLKELSFLESPDTPPEQTDRSEQLVPEAHHLVAFTTLFASREGVYARQWVSPTGESGYTPIHEPLNSKVAENHILGNYTIGAYPVRLDNTVNYVALDLDVAKFALNKAITSQKAFSALMTKAQKVACDIVDCAAAHDLPAYIEDSGFKGRHCWIFLDTPIPAAAGMKLAMLLRNEIMPLPQELTVELFPKQSSVRSGGLGNLIKLPLGLHRRTGNRALFLQPDGHPVKNQLAFMESVSKADRRSIQEAIQRLNSRTQVVVPPWMPAPEDSEVSETRKAAPLPRIVETPYNLDTDPQFQYLMLKCAPLKSIADKANRTAMLTNEESLVLIHTVGHLDHGPEAVNELFRRCMNADPALFLKSQLKGNPMSCPKIRSRIPETTAAVPCNCAFDLAVNLYPTPLIHVRQMTDATHAVPLGLTVDSLQFQNLLQDYLKLQKQLRETTILLSRYEARLKQVFEDAGVEFMETPMGRLKLLKKEGEEVSFHLEM